MPPQLKERYRAEGEWALWREHVVRWAECDIYAHINHAAYLTLFEDMRIEWWLSVGGSFAPGAMGPVVGTLEVRYHRPGRFRDRVLLGARAVSFRRSSFVHEYGMWREGEGLLCSARAVCVVVDSVSGEKRELPASMRAIMVARDGAQAER